MDINRLPHVGEAVSLFAKLDPEKIGARDSARDITYRQWNERAARLANGLLGLGLVKGDRVAILAFNCVEWLEIYVAMAKAGLVAVPINFRLVGPEIAFIVQNCNASAMIVQDILHDKIEDIRNMLPISTNRYVLFGGSNQRSGYRSYEDIIATASAAEPDVDLKPADAWAFMYTSGTTGKPKGAIRNHDNSALLAVITALEMELGRNDIGLLVMPLCHSNSLWYATLLAYCGATAVIYDREHFDPEYLLRILYQEKITFTSLVPTHYIMMLGLPEAVKNRYRSDSVKSLLISSAPARRDTKLAIMEFYNNTKLYEAYGSTEAGWVTILRPDEQFKKLGSIGRELIGSMRIKLMDFDGNECADGQVGEIYSYTPYAFRGYWNLPEKTAEAFHGDYCSVGDMAFRDEDGYYFLAGRKSNMIISGGENIYPSEVENVLGANVKVKDVAVIGVPDEKWGETVMAVIVLHDRQTATEQEIMDWCRDKIGGYKRPHYVRLISDEQMPRTATGKIQHRILKERYGSVTR
jgi:fatty-acyl-CoA synthase